MTSEIIIDRKLEELFRDISFPAMPARLYDPLRYMIAIGGKRIRPRLCLTACSLFRDDLPQDVLNAAQALEVFHTFTLIHDDIMDCSPLRRGKQTVWKKWDKDVAILSGDVMQIDAYIRLSKISPRYLDRILDLFSRTASQVCEGQQYDMDFEHRSNVGMEEYAQMIGLKTAVLLACSAGMGAILGGAPDNVCESLYDYGYQLGMAFQIADDYLDAYGEEKSFGKPIGGDIINGKKSWLTIRTAEKCPQRDILEKAMAMPSGTPSQAAEKISAVKEIYDRYGIGDDAKEEIVRYSREAIRSASLSGLGKDAVERLTDFCESLVGRAR